MSTEIRILPRGECVGFTGALEKAWQQCFPNGLPWLTIIWHAGWLHRSDKTNHWCDLHEKLKACGEGTKILVVIFDESPRRTTKSREGNPLAVLLRAINAGTSSRPDREQGVGWASITDIAQFSSQALKWNSNAIGGNTLSRLCEVCANLIETKQSTVGNGEIAVPTLDEFFAFLANPMVYRARKLHAAGGDSEKAKRGLRLLKWLEAFVFVPAKLPLNILLVENDPDKLAVGINKTNAEIEDFVFGAGGPKDFFRGAARVYLLRRKEDFDKLDSPIGRENLQAEIWDLTTPLPDTGLPKDDVPWKQLDLILQDLVLDNNEARLHGLELATHYFEACPQALVFLLTGLDVESLVGSGDVNWRYVDAIISKNAIETLPYEYRRCFQERFGRMFWPDWPDLKDDESLSSRATVRKFFGCLRKWQIEPAILGHGQGVPEMIDHADRHIGCLWRLTDDFLGEIFENLTPPSGRLTVEDRMLLTMSVWLHDTGHRGDEFHENPADVRTFHAGISERLLLRDPDAYGLEWLLKFCYGNCKNLTTGQGTRLGKCRNRPVKDGQCVCPLRAIGLLCRHHQSNAPLDSSSFEGMQSKGKVISPYCRVKSPSDDENCDYEAQLSLWVDPTRPLEGWSGSRVMTLEDFATNQRSLLGLAGLLRMLDGIQIHRRRVGSPEAVRSFEVYLSNRGAWAARELNALNTALAEMTPGTREYLGTLGKRQQLENYRRLVCVQHIHYRQQLAVYDVEVRWLWQPRGVGTVEIGFVLDDRALVRLSQSSATVPGSNQSFQILKDVINRQNEGFKKDSKSGASEISRRILSHAGLKSHPLVDTIAAWAIHVLGDFIEKEHDSQTPKTGGDLHPYLRLLEGTRFRISLLGLASQRLSPPIILFEQPNKP